VRPTSIEHNDENSLRAVVLLELEAPLLLETNLWR